MTFVSFLLSLPFSPVAEVRPWNTANCSPREKLVLVAVIMRDCCPTGLLVYIDYMVRLKRFLKAEYVRVCCCRIVRVAARKLHSNSKKLRRTPRQALHAHFPRRFEFHIYIYVCVRCTSPFSSLNGWASEVRYVTMDPRVVGAVVQRPL